MSQPLSRDRAEHYRWGEVCDGWRLVKNRELSVIEERMPPGATEKRHFHASAQQCFYVLEGEARMEVESESFLVRQGESVHVAPGQAHCIRNVSTADVRFLVISTPSTEGDRYAA